jgi:hypothetical protein
VDFRLRTFLMLQNYKTIRYSYMDKFGYPLMEVVMLMVHKLAFTVSYYVTKVCVTFIIIN